MDWHEEESSLEMIGAVVLLDAGKESNECLDDSPQLWGFTGGCRLEIFDCDGCSCKYSSKQMNEVVVSITWVFIQFIGFLHAICKMKFFESSKHII